jgi:replicative DNA helicase
MKDIEIFFSDCQDVFTKILYDESAKSSLEYLRNRGYTDEQIKYFKVGFFPDEQVLLKHLGKYEEEINTYFAGIIKSNKSFNDKKRITIPWFHENKIVGFSVRAISESSSKFKYMNNNLMEKGNYLFNNTTDISNKIVVVVEGLFDALSGTYLALQDKATIDYHFLATGNSYLNDKQIDILRQAKKIILLLDNDNAGKTGLESSKKKLLQKGVTAYIASIPKEYKDIDEYIKENQNIKEIMENIQEVKAEEHIINLEKFKEEIRNKIKTSIETKEQIDVKEAEELKDKYIIELKKLDPTAQDNKEIKDIRNIIDSIKEINKIISKKSRINDDYNWDKFKQDLQESSNTNLKTGFKELDENINIQPSSLVFIAGRPGHGKTTFMINMLRNMIEASINANDDKSFVFFSYEETRKDILTKYMLSMTDESNFKCKDNLLFKLRDCIRTGKADYKTGEIPYQIKDITERLLEEKRLIILNTDSNVESLSKNIIDLTEENKNIGAVYVDYVQKLNASEGKANRQQEIQNICKVLLETSLKVGVPIILGSQVNREVKSIDTFNASNMREAGDIEQDANIILGIWDNEAAKISEIEEIIKGLEEKKIKATIECKTNEKEEIEKKIGKAEEEIEKLKKDKTTKKTIKILKNRNGKNNIKMEIKSNQDRFLFICKEEGKRDNDYLNNLLKKLNQGKN